MYVLLKLIIILCLTTLDMCVPIEIHSVWITSYYSDHIAHCPRAVFVIVYNKDYVYAQVCSQSA